MNLKEHIYKFDHVAIGSSLNALVYAYLNNLPIFFSNVERPFRFDFFDENEDLNIFDVENTKTTLQAPNGELSLGLEKYKLYDDLMFNMSLSGQIPFSDKISSISFEDNNIIKFITKNNKMVKASYSRATIFSQHNLKGVNFLHDNSDSDKYKVYDWINVRSGMKHDLDIIKTDDEFVNKIFFYPSDRICGNHDKKDAVSVSYMSMEQLLDLDYSEIYIKFKVLDLMKSAGIKGTSNGKNINNPLKTNYRSIRIETAYREYEKINDQKENIHFKDVTVNHQSLNEIINSSINSDSYMKRVRKIINEDRNAKRQT